MIDLSDFAQTLENKAVAVFGLGLSGLASVKALVNAGIAVTAWDDNKDNQNKAKELGAVIDDLTVMDLSKFDFLLLAPGVPYTYDPHPVVLKAQEFNLEIIGDLELLHRSNHGIKTIGITGTNGKSTTTALMTHVLNECGMTAIMGGNIGKAVMEMDLTDVDVLVLEISSYQMDLCPIYRPDISMLLNITSDHLDRHGSMKSYVEAKAKILEGKGLALISIDDDFSMEKFDDIFCKGHRKTIPISMHTNIPEGLFVKDSILFHNHRGEDIKIGSLEGLNTLKGTHNHQNATFVYAAASNLGLEATQIFNAFKTYAGLQHRQYLVTKNNNVTYVNDSKATNAEAAAKALSSYENVFWIIGGRAKDGGLQGLEIFKDKIVKTYVIGEAREDFSKWLEENKFEYQNFETLSEATVQASAEANAFNGECVVLLSPACASWDQFRSFEVRGDAFTNKVLELVKA